MRHQAIASAAGRSSADRRAALPDLAALKHAPLYSEELGLDLAGGRERDLFLWFLASLLFGQRISETIARHTFESFVRHGLTAPQRILDAGWDYLVNPVMREGGYVRYDESKSRKLLRDCGTLIDEYGGRVARLHEAARDAADLAGAAAGLLRRRPGHGEHLSSRVAAVLGEGRSRAACRSCAKLPGGWASTSMGWTARALNSRAWRPD